MSPKPTIVAVPGAWHTPEIYDATFSHLKAHGYNTVGVPLPSAGANPAHPNFDQDVQGIRDALVTLVEEQGKDVVLVTHSYTGMPGSQAPAGLGKKEREEKGLSGGVVRLVYIMSFAMPEGFQPTAGGAQFPEWMKPDMQTGLVTVDAEDAKRIFYHDIPSDEADKWAAKLLPQSMGVYTSTQTYAAWRHIPSTFVIGTEDKSAFTSELVDFIINTARQLEPSAFDVVEKCDGGHCLMISRPEWLAGVLRRAAGEVI